MVFWSHQPNIGVRLRKATESHLHIVIRSSNVLKQFDIFKTQNSRLANGDNSIGFLVLVRDL